MNKRLFLTSSIGAPGVAKAVRRAIGGSKVLKTAFITTPVEPKSEQTDLSWYEADRLALKAAGFNIFDYTFTGKHSDQIAKDLANIEALYVSGGNTNYLLQQAQQSGFISWVKQYIHTGKPYLGTSAGSIIAGPSLPEYLWDSVTPGASLSNYACFGLVPFTVIPHWGSPFFKDEYLGPRLPLIYKDSLQAFIILNDHQFIEVEDEKITLHG